MKAVSLALLLALAIFSVDSKSVKNTKISCYFGSPSDYAVVPGFDSCVSVHNINDNSIEMLGLHKNTALEKYYNVGDFSSDCVVRVKAKQFIVSCQCFTPLCNVPKNGEELLEHGFDVDSDE